MQLSRYQRMLSPSSLLGFALTKLTTANIVRQQNKHACAYSTDPVKALQPATCPWSGRERPASKESLHTRLHVLSTYVFRLRHPHSRHITVLCNVVICIIWRKETFRSLELVFHLRHMSSVPGQAPESGALLPEKVLRASGHCSSFLPLENDEITASR